MAQNQQIPGPSQMKDRTKLINQIGTPASGINKVDEIGYGSTRQTKITLSSFPVAITRTSNVVAGNSGTTDTGLLYTFPEGYIAIRGAVMSITIASRTMADSANGVTSLGTVQNTATPATLAAAGEATIIASATTAIASSAGSRNALSVATLIAPIDGTTTPAGLYFNYGSADDITASGFIDLTGVIYISWENIGDYL